MAKKTKDKKKPSRNVLVLTETIKKGRGKNKHTEVKAKRGRLGSRLFCVPLTPKKRGKEAKFECFGSWEDAQAAILSRVPARPQAYLGEEIPNKPGKGKGKMTAKEEAEMARFSGMRGLRSSFSPRNPRPDPYTRVQDQVRLRRWAEEVKSLEEDLRSGWAAKHPDYPENGFYSHDYKGWWDRLMAQGELLAEKYPTIRDTVRRADERLSEAFAEAQSENPSLRGLRGALPARGLQGTPEEHSARVRALDLVLGVYDRHDVDKNNPQYLDTLSRISEEELWLPGAARRARGR